MTAFMLIAQYIMHELSYDSFWRNSSQVYRVQLDRYDKGELSTRWAAGCAGIGPDLKANFPEVKKWKALELKRIYVLTEFHGKGIAQKLMNFILDFATEKKYEVVWLGVWEHNLRAQKFYEKYGFVNSGYTHDFPIGSTPQTDFWLWKFLKY